MLYRCQLCEKKSHVGHLVSHAKNRSSKTWRPNLHWKKIDLAGQKVRLRMCTRCIRTMKKVD